MTELLITGARPYGEDPVDLLVRDGAIAEIGSELDRDDRELLDGAGLILLPGFVDLHTHLREPGGEESEDVGTGSAAAALGGPTPMSCVRTCGAGARRWAWSMCTRSAPSRSGSTGSGWPSWARWPGPGCGCSPTTAAACTIR
jgi:predicted amidohydrolase YtcJ